ncbi:MAG: hypothetical protein EAZ85_05700 [Bacteroidetes bacterium]|nr:MAG: hypothetical protein EAZ85_05700 [Bacteroidota bacterium]TAG89170.1 MAG: hypothetical protein EAZ20_07060 [Bacteroidota bacterium]
MTKNRIQIIFYTFLFFSFITHFSCANKEKYMKKNIDIKDSLALKKEIDFDKIEYIYSSASVSPQYYRNYVIEVLRKSCHIKISDYAKELAKHDFKVKKSDWKMLQKMTYGLEKENVKITNGATGTHGNTIILYKKNKKVYTLSWDSLSEVNEGTQKFKNLVLELIKPNVKELVDKTIQ